MGAGPCEKWRGKEIIVSFAGDGMRVSGRLLDLNEAAGWITLESSPDTSELVVYLHAVRSIHLSVRQDEEEWQARFMPPPGKEQPHPG